MRADTFVKMLTAELCALAALLWGSLDGLMTGLLIVMGLDLVTGLIVGAEAHNLNSAVCFRGLARKMLILVMVALGHALDAYIFGGESAVCRSAVIGLYFANEGLSILENAGKMGLPLPKKLRDMLVQLKQESKEEDDDNDSNGKQS